MDGNGVVTAAVRGTEFVFEVRDDGSVVTTLYDGAVSAMAGSIAPTAIGMTLAHHGLVIFGDDPRQCHQRMTAAVAKIEAYLAACRKGKRVLGGTVRPARPAAERQQLAATVLPAVRDTLGAAERVILHFDDGEDVLETLAQERTPELVRRGMTTPEHLLRAGRLPLWLDLDPALAPDALAAQVTAQIAVQRAEYEAYHRRHAAADQPPLDGLGQGGPGAGDRDDHGVQRQEERGDRQPLLPRRAREPGECGGGGAVRVPP